MATALRPMMYSPVPPAPGAHHVDYAHWQVDQGRRLAPGGGVNGAAGDGPGGNAWPTVQQQPFTRMAGGAYAQESRWTRAQSPSYGDVYGPRQYGGPQNPRQPYRANAGINVQVRMWPKPLPVHLYAGAKSLGVPVTAALQQQMAALLVLRQKIGAPRQPQVRSTLAGTGIGTRTGAMGGVPFNRG